MKNRVLSLFGALLLVSSTIAVAATMKPDHPESYTVVRGDTLWGISGKFLTNPWEWPEIWQVNPQIENPHKIYPGDTLSLVYVDGKPTLQLHRGLESNTVKLSPYVGVTKLDNAIPAIPLEEVHAFMRDSRFVHEEDMEGAAYVMAGAKQHIIAGAGDEIFGRGKFGRVNTIYGIYREGKAYSDPETDEFLGIQATAVGEARLVSQKDGIARLLVNKTHGEIRVGDTLLPTIEEPLRAFFQPSTPMLYYMGKIIGVENGVSQIGLMDVVIVNLGARNKIEPGNIMFVHREGEEVYDPIAREHVQLPDERAGLLMFFKVHEKLSYALVLTADQVMSVGDKVVRP